MFSVPLTGGLLYTKKEHMGFTSEALSLEFLFYGIVFHS